MRGPEAVEARSDALSVRHIRADHARDLRSDRGRDSAVSVDARGRAGRWSAFIAALFMTAMPAGLAARAADLPPPAAVDPASAPPTSAPWRFQATLYGWATGINGDVGMRHLPDHALDVPFHEVLANLEGGAMGAFYATNGQWMVFADLVYAKLSHDLSSPALGGVKLDLGLTQTILSGAVGYVLPLSRPDLDVSVTGGLRYVSFKATESINFMALPISLGARETEDWLDPTIGLFSRWRLDPKWFITGLVDLGGFGVGSKLSSAGYLGVDYQWTKGFSTGLGYRYLYEDYEGATTPTGTFRYRATMHGPALSASWQF